MKGSLTGLPFFLKVSKKNKIIGLDLSGFQNLTDLFKLSLLWVNASVHLFIICFSVVR
jgi:hypothetical protein